MDPDQFHALLKSWCSQFGASVTSYYRTEQRNAAVDGAPGSAHRFWLAADVVYDELPSQGERELAAHRLGLYLEIEADHDHLGPLRWAS